MNGLDFHTGKEHRVRYVPYSYSYANAYSNTQPDPDSNAYTLDK